ncbi:tRNA lysidine(34) synthetase TilS [Pararhodobacter marinus]|uniref:tRNA lysidine(34) synthetase TilS n=1 Tax=Pararhodobacter marinus TaxID=2184063 RepID=UPI0035143D8B
MSGAALSAIRTACGGLERVGVAVSGGGDSVAALVLAVEALGPARVAAVTVDHGLRAEAAGEAAGVAALCARLGVAHDILRWEAGPQGGNLMDAARAARFALIGNWARGRVDAVVLAHTLDDQAETVLMRLARGSGVDGLSGMAARRQAGGVLWLRPFLEVSRADLRDALQARGIGWVEDPTNADPRFLRVRARQALDGLRALGIEAGGLVRTAGRMARARAALEAQAQAVLARDLREERGVLILRGALAGETDEIRARIMAHLAMALSGAAYRPRFDALQRWMAAGEGTLMGCVLWREGADWRLAREARAVGALRVPVGAVWDGRWRAEAPDAAAMAAEGTEIRALGESGLAVLGRQARAGLHPHPRETGLPRGVMAGLPAIWRDEALVAAPLVFWPEGWSLTARPVAAFHDTPSQSH